MVREPVGIGESPVIVPWTDHIEDPVVRRETRELLSAMPFINAGFAAGTAGALMRYLREGDRLLNTDLKGVLHWGDQVAMGIIFIIIRTPGERSPTAGTTASSSANTGPTGLGRTGEWRVPIEAPVHVVHGNGRTLEPVGDVIRGLMPGPEVLMKLTENSIISSLCGPVGRIFLLGGI